MDATETIHTRPTDEACGHGAPYGWCRDCGAQMCVKCMRESVCEMETGCPVCKGAKR